MIEEAGEEERQQAIEVLHSATGTTGTTSAVHWESIEHVEEVMKRGQTVNSWGPLSI